MQLNKNKALIVFDLETTGTDVTNDRIVEIALLKVLPNGDQKKLEFRINPTVPIPKESSEVHGIWDQDIKDAPTFAEIADEIANFIGDSDLAGYNSNKFDIPLLAEEFLRINHSIELENRNFIDVQNIFHKMEQRTLVAAYKFYCDKELLNAHNAMSDVQATYEVFKAQLDRYEELEKSSEFLAAFSQQNKNKLLDFAGRIALNEHNKAIYNFGKHKGKTLEQVDKEEPGYYGWMLNSNFPLYTKKVLKKEMEAVKAQKDGITNSSKKVKDDISNKLEALKAKFSKD